jgi:hypothetical protein
VPAGYVLASGLYFVVAAHLTAAQLVLLGAVESTGEIIGGFALAALARAGGIPGTLLTSAALIVATGALVARRPGRTAPGA